MKYSKRYICLTIILLLVVALKFNRNGSEQVETFRGAQMEPKVWNPLIAESVNENPLSLVVDNRIYSNEDYDIYMNQKLDIMIPVSLVRDSFNCSAGLYDKEKLVVEKHEESADFSLEDKQLTKKTTIIMSLPQNFRNHCPMIIPGISRRIRRPQQMFREQLLFIQASMICGKKDAQQRSKIREALAPAGHQRLSVR